MNTGTIIRQAEMDGVLLALSDTGKVKASGDQDAVNRWLPTIREHKQEIVAALHDSGRNEPETETGCWRELDALILHYAQLTDMPAERLERLLAARMKMAPIKVQADIDQFKKWIVELKPQTTPENALPPHAKRHSEYNGDQIT